MVWFLFLFYFLWVEILISSIAPYPLCLQYTYTKNPHRGYKWRTIKKYIYTHPHTQTYYKASSYKKFGLQMSKFSIKMKVTCWQLEEIRANEERLGNQPQKKRVFYQINYLLPWEKNDEELHNWIHFDILQMDCENEWVLQQWFFVSWKIFKKN